MRQRIKQIKQDKTLIGKEIVVNGWIRTIREQKTFAFIEINDGSTLSNLQVIAPPNLEAMTTGAAIQAKGKLVESPGGKQSVEIQATKIDLIGSCHAEDYPLQKKRHSFEFLRSIAHLRPRTNTIGAVTRVRNELSYATHRFFQEKGFLNLHTPIITLSDCEGAGELFEVKTSEKEDFFGSPAYLTVSGQLNAEIYSCALSDVYTFGPTFRAENSNTSRHLAEFWMVEPEMAFADIDDDMDLAEAYLKEIFESVLTQCSEEMDFFNRFISKGVKERLESVVSSPFERITYTEAIEILKTSNQTFEFPTTWGCDFQAEHERYLCEQHFKKPVIVYNYPLSIKPFYMRVNDDQKTVANMDVLVPGVGEIIGGSQREERLDILSNRMDALEMDKEEYWWYLELRKYGSVPHAGFGAGFERLILFATGMENIRDVIPFPRYPGHAAF
ncbi:MAG: Asparagine--tRNA ligase [Chlamydiales bacterium]|nr:Asparagine--tRNA ligase [Chlamydiales bacterium]MCH9619384.1 Asparagine--tRNA ligase [Chlamydiales bacterium]MCH9622188.1 Asparagine--tRNA ligase [Chlamydiales bacterium]